MSYFLNIQKLDERKKDILIILFLLFIACYLRPIPHIGVMGRDETSYAFLAKHFLNGTFLDYYIFTAFHPLFSFIASLIAYVGVNPELAGRIVSYSFGVLSVIPTYFIGKTLFSQTTGFIAGFFTATFPVLIKWAGVVQAQTTYSFMLLMSMYFLCLFFKKQKLLYSALGGLFLSLAYLSRAEGLGIFAGNLFLYIIFLSKKRKEVNKNLAGLAVFIFVFLLIASPYVYALRLKTGETKFTNKFSNIRDAVIVSYNLDYEKYNYGNLDIPKKELLKMAVKVYPKKIIECFKNFPNYFGILSLILVAIPIIWLFFEPIQIRNYLYFIPYLYVLLILPFFFVAENYFIPYAPFVFILAGFGADVIDKAFQKKIKRFNIPIIIISLLFLVGYENVFHNKIKSFFVKPNPIPDLQTIVYSSYRDFGREVSSIVKPDSRIMTRFNIGAWYANGEYVSFPDVNWEQFVKSVRQQKVDYIIIGPAEMGMRQDIYNELFWRINGIIKDDNFSLVKRSVNVNFIEFYLIKVKANE